MRRWITYYAGKSHSHSQHCSNSMAEEKQRYGGGAGVGNGIVAVEPKPRKGLSSKVIDLVEKMVVKLMHGYHASLPHQHYLSGTFAPVSGETPPTTNLLLKGHLPVRTLLHYATTTTSCVNSEYQGFFFFLVHNIDFHNGNASKSNGHFRKFHWNHKSIYQIW